IETRWAVERHGLERAVTAPGGVDARVVAGMRAVVEHQRALLAAGELDEFVNQDREFHRVAVAATGNAILIPLYDSLRDRQRRMVRRTVRDDHDRAADVLAQHEAILATLEAGKQSKLVKLLADHLRDTRATLLGIEDTAPAGTPPRGPGA
ncbi:MAG: FCD domain-containing protein, partial [Patulibacter sp.]|nr:FCD domain-containing protein [Patulibacter sp.]